MSGQGRFDPASSAEGGTSVAAELLGRDDLSMLAPGKLADIGSVIVKIDFVMRDRILYHDLTDRPDRLSRTANRKATKEA
jgi:imidazolonepropionase-like amidohydrolase